VQVHFLWCGYWYIHISILKYYSGVTGILCETLGRRTPPVLAVPYLKRDLARHPTFKKSVALLRKCGVRVLHKPEWYPSSSMIPFDEIIAILHIMIQEGDAQKKNTGVE
jgi:hypothetical protein